MTGHQEVAGTPIAEPSTSPHGIEAARCLQGQPFAPLPAPDTDVTYLALGDIDARRQINNLKLFGFRVAAHSDLAAGLEAVADQEKSILVLHAEPLTLPAAVARTRSTLPSVWLIVAAEFPDRVSRVAAMLAGADTCTDASPDSLELAATVMATSRRLARGAGLGGDAAGSPQGSQAGKTEGWQLTNHGWTLRSPDGTSIKLNSTEREIMCELLDRPEVPLVRTKPHDFGEPEQLRVKRNMDVAISRLRKKAAEHSLQLPIKSVRGVGYMFVADTR